VICFRKYGRGQKEKEAGHYSGLNENGRSKILEGRNQLHTRLTAATTQQRN
jgi:hypothetical protein